MAASTPIAVAVDAVVLATAADASALQVLLVCRANPPWAGAWALPGGFVEPEEALHTAAARELEEETGVQPPVLEQVGAYGEPGRDPRGRVVSVAYVALLRADAVAPRAATDARETRWFPVDALPALAFDHADILADARALLHGRAHHAPLGRGLLHEPFALDELRGLYEQVLGAPLAPEPFAQELLATGLLAEAADAAPGRYRFDTEAYDRLRRAGLCLRLRPHPDGEAASRP